MQSQASKIGFVIASLLTSTALVMFATDGAIAQATNRAAISARSAEAIRDFRRMQSVRELVDQDRTDLALSLTTVMSGEGESFNTRVESLRLASRIYLKQGDAVRALQQLDTAASLLDGAPPENESRQMRSRILLDRAEVHGFGGGDSAAAVAVYDEFVGQYPEADVHLRLMAKRNAAMIASSLGNYASAVTRGQELLASSDASAMTGEDRMLLQASIAGWLQNDGRLVEASQLLRGLWDANPTSLHWVVIEAGIQVARWLPANSHCDERVELLSRALVKVRQLPAGSEDRVRLERDAQTGLADSAGCPDTNGVIGEARRALGLNN